LFHNPSSLILDLVSRSDPSIVENSSDVLGKLVGRNDLASFDIGFPLFLPSAATTFTTGRL
jgi:hypothetical protein